MNKERKNVVFSIGSAVAVALTFAANGYAADNVPSNRTISSIQTYKTWAAVRFDPPYTNSVGCPGAGANNAAVIEWGTDADKKVMYAALLAASVSGEQIGLGISSCFASYGGGVPLIYRVDLN